MKARIKEYERQYKNEAMYMYGFEAEIDINDYVKYRIEGYNPDESYRRVLLDIYRSL